MRNSIKLILNPMNNPTFTHTGIPQAPGRSKPNSQLHF